MKRQRFHTNALKNMLTQDICMSYIKNHIPKNHNTWQNVNALWRKVKQPFIDVWGVPKAPQKKKLYWISDFTIAVIENSRRIKTLRNAARTRAAKAMYDSQYRYLHRGVKRSCRSSKRNWTTSISCQVEVVALKNNLRELYRQSRVFTGKYGSATHSTKVEKYAIIPSERDQLARFFKHDDLNISREFFTQ